MHDRLFDRLQRLRQRAADQVRIGLIGDDEKFAIDKAIGTGGIAGAGIDGNLSKSSLRIAIPLFEIPAAIANGRN